MAENIKTPCCCGQMSEEVQKAAAPSSERVKRLRDASFDQHPCISIERALLETEFYREHEGKLPMPVLRGANFKHLCENKTLYIGKDELIVGERGPFPKAVSTFPELTCHTRHDFEVLTTRAQQNYTVASADMDIYEKEVEPYWRGRCMRDKLFERMPEAWNKLYEAGTFTEFGEQRALGHTSLDNTIYHKGALDMKKEIAEARAKLDFINDPEATAKDEQLQGMDISCDAVIIFAERHADLAEKMAAEEKDEKRKAELLKIADVCRWVPAHAPRDFWEAVQMYWFVHLATITELNGWDAMSPGHLDQHLGPFYEKGLADGTFTRDEAKELLACLFIKVNNTPAPPKVGVTAKESGTYNDFTNINLAGLKRDGHRRLERSHLHLPRTLQRTAPAPAAGQHPGQRAHARQRHSRRGESLPQRHGLPVGLQRRHGHPGADARRQIARRRARRRHQRLHRDRLLRQGSVPAPRLPQRAEAP